MLRSFSAGNENYGIVCCWPILARLAALAIESVGERVMRKQIYVAGFCSIFLSSTSVLSQENVAPGSIVVPVAPQPLRADPPGFFQGKGAEVGVISPDEKYIVLDQKSVPSMIGSETWVRLKAANSELTGWSLYGRGSQTLSNFRTLQ